MEEKQKKLLELGADLALLGEQVTLAQLCLKDLVEKKGHPLSSPEAVNAARQCSAVECQFLALEEEYQSLWKALRRGCEADGTDGQPPLTSSARIK